MKFPRLVRKAVVALSFVGMATTFGGQSADAATEVSNLTVDATVLSSCTISTAPVNFGTYDPLGTHNTNPLDNSAGQVRITCANGLPVVVRLGQGATPAAGSTAAAPDRQMAGPAPGDVLSYNLFTDAPGGIVWGDTAGTGVARVGTGLLDTLFIHGRVPGGQNPASGAYGDTVVASVDF
jgi:spore coat protein U-like protein